MNVSRPVEMTEPDEPGRKRQKQAAVGHGAGLHLQMQAAAMSLDAAYGGSHVGKSGCTR